MAVKIPKIISPLPIGFSLVSLRKIRSRINGRRSEELKYVFVPNFRQVSFCLNLLSPNLLFWFRESLLNAISSIVLYWMFIANGIYRYMPQCFQISYCYTLFFRQMLETCPSPNFDSPKVSFALFNFSVSKDIRGNSTQTLCLLLKIWRITNFFIQLSNEKFSRMISSKFLLDGFQLSILPCLLFS